MTSNDDYVLQLLLEQNLVTQDQVDTAAVSLRQEGETTVDVLLHMGVISEEDKLTLIDSHSAWSTSASTGDLDASIATASRGMARKYGVAPLTERRHPDAGDQRPDELRRDRQPGLPA